MKARGDNTLGGATASLDGTQLARHRLEAGPSYPSPQGTVLSSFGHPGRDRVLHLPSHTGLDSGAARTAAGASYPSPPGIVLGLLGIPAVAGPTRLSPDGYTTTTWLSPSGIALSWLST